MPKITALAGALESGAAVSRFSEDDCAVFARYAEERDSRYPRYRAFVRLVDQMLEALPPAVSSGARYWLMPAGEENAGAASTGEAARMGIRDQRLYDYRLSGVDQALRQAVWAEIAVYLHGKTGWPARVLDAGAGRCEFINTVPAAGRWAVDVRGCDEYRHPGVRAVPGGIVDAELPRGYLDSVFVSNVLERLFPSQDAVGAALARLGESLAGGGRIAVMGPNFRYCARGYFDCADHTLAVTHVAVAEHLGAGRLRRHRGDHEVPAVFLPQRAPGVTTADPDIPALPHTVAGARQAVPDTGGQARSGTEAVQPGEQPEMIGDVSRSAAQDLPAGEQHLGVFGLDLRPSR